MHRKDARRVWREAVRKRPGSLRNEHETSPGSPPYLQKAQIDARRKDAWNRRRLLPRGVHVLAAVLQGAGAMPVGVLKEADGTPKSR